MCGKLTQVEKDIIEAVLLPVMMVIEKVQAL